MYLLALPELRAAQNPARSTSKNRCCSSPCTPTSSSTSMRSASTRGSLSKYKLPVEITVLDDLPKNAVGKIAKPSLRQRFAATP